MKTNKVYQLFLISLIGLTGTILPKLLPIAVPPSIIGMMLLLILLVTRTVKLNQIGDVAHFFLTYMGLLFIPPVVDVAARYHLLGEQIVQFIIICVLSTVLTFVSSLGAAKLVIYMQEKYSKREVRHV